MYCVKCVQIRNFFWYVFSAFGLSTGRYEVSLRIQSECGKIRTRKNSVFGHISWSDLRKSFYKNLLSLIYFWSRARLAISKNQKNCSLPDHPFAATSIVVFYFEERKNKLVIKFAKIIAMIIFVQKYLSNC